MLPYRAVPDEIEEEEEGVGNVRFSPQPVQNPLPESPSPPDSPGPKKRMLKLVREAANKWTAKCVRASLLFLTFASRFSMLYHDAVMERMARVPVVAVDTRSHSAAWEEQRCFDPGSLWDQNTAFQFRMARVTGMIVDGLPTTPFERHDFHFLGHMEAKTFVGLRFSYCPHFKKKARQEYDYRGLFRLASSVSLCVVASLLMLRMVLLTAAVLPLRTVVLLVSVVLSSVLLLGVVRHSMQEQQRDFLESQPVDFRLLALENTSHTSYFTGSFI
jgi:hypothetical protein